MPCLDDDSRQKVSYREAHHVSLVKNGDALPDDLRTLRGDMTKLRALTSHP